MTHTVHQPSTALPASGHASRLVEVAIATPIEAELVASIRAVSERVSLLYQPELLPPTRYPEDHRGVAGFRRDAKAEGRWQGLLARAEVLFGIPDDSPQGLAAVMRGSPRLRWVQGTAAGTGEQLKAAGLSKDELERVTVTSASGVHVGPLAEFCLLGLLAFTKGLPR
ncbi:MAG: D-2-hydroxyacid dehydrogenase, partial [Actinobacteria bacterium]|nr:D-2-hydroxyacid dehydrogenase [Actinomycetota bacterium]